MAHILTSYLHYQNVCPCSAKLLGCGMRKRVRAYNVRGPGRPRSACASSSVLVRKISPVKNRDRTGTSKKSWAIFDKKKKKKKKKGKGLLLDNNRSECLIFMFYTKIYLILIIADGIKISQWSF